MKGTMQYETCKETHSSPSAKACTHGGAQNSFLPLCSALSCAPAATTAAAPSGHWLRVTQVPEDALQTFRALFALVAEGRETVGPQQVARLLTMLGLQAGPAEVRRVLLGAEHKAERRIAFPDLLQVGFAAGWAPMLQRQAAWRRRARGHATCETTTLRPLLSPAAPLQALTGLPRGAAGKRELHRAFAYLAGEGLPLGYISTHALSTALARAL